MSRRLEQKPVPPVPATVRRLCRCCLGFVGGECRYCNGTGYEVISPYAEHMGEQAWQRPDGSAL